MFDALIVLILFKKFLYIFFYYLIEFVYNDIKSLHLKIFLLIKYLLIIYIINVKILINKLLNIIN